MYFVLGLLTAGLLALAVTPAVWRRAHRLAKARVESGLPMSLGEVQAEKDQLRAGFAMASRRLEIRADDLRNAANEQAIELSRSRAEIGRLGGDLAERSATVESLEARVAGLIEDVRAGEARIEAGRAEIAARDMSLAERAGQIAALQAGLAAAELLTEEQKVELVARDTKIGNFQDQLAASRAAEAQLVQARDELAAELAAERAGHAGEVVRGQGLEARISAFETERIDRLAALERRSGEIKAMEAELAAARAEREKLAASVAALETERTERLRELTRRSEEIEALKAEIAAGRQGGGAPAEAAPSAAQEGGDNVRKAIEAIEAEKTALAARIAALEADQAGILAENAELRRLAGADLDAARAADQKIRERLAEIAASVLHMTQSSGNGEAKPALVRTETAIGNGNGRHAGSQAAPAPAAAPRAAASPQASETERSPERSLAERIRALQHAARH